MDILDFKQLEAFAQVVDQGSFSKAAEKLHLTQPTVSAHISSLEGELETQLIVRTPRAAYPSETGKLLYEYASDMLSLRDNAVAICKKKKNEMNGTVIIAASTIPYQYLLPAAMSDFRELHPEITFKLSRHDSAGVVASVLSGKAELGMTGTIIEDAKLVYREICGDDLVVITQNAAPYTEMEPRFSLQALLKEPYVVREPGSGTRIETEEYLQKNGIDPARLNIVAQMDNPDAIKSAVSQGLGVSVVSALSADDFERLGLIRTFQLEGGPITRKLYFVHHKHRPLSATAKRFQQFVTEGSGTRQ